MIEPMSAGREFALSPSAATLAASLRAMSFWRRVHQHVRRGVAVPDWGPVTALAPWGLGLCRAHTTLTVLPSVTPLSPPRLAAGLSSLSQGQVQNVLDCVQPHPPALQGWVQGSSMCRAQPGGVTVGTSGICSFPCTSDGRWLLCFHVHGE